MFETGKLSAGEQRARVELAETADILEALLPYCYSASIAAVQLSGAKWAIIRAAEKYQLLKEAVRRASG